MGASPILRLINILLVVPKAGADSVNVATFLRPLAIWSFTALNICPGNKVLLT